jgi:beta-lactamase class A
MRRSWSLLAFVVAIIWSAVGLRDAGAADLLPAAAPVHPAAASTQAAFQALAKRLEARIKGRIGISARLLETGESFSVAGDEPFPMASTFKVAVAATVLSRVDRGELKLDQMVPITDRDLEASGPIAQSVPHPGISLSIRNILELMLTQSNNTAADKMTALAGGPAAVTAWLKAHHIEGQRVDGDTNAILNRFTGQPIDAPFLKTYLAAHPEAGEDDDLKPDPAFDDSPLDTSSPNAMANLLTLLFTGDALKPESRRVLIETMLRCETGHARLKGLLPAGTPVAHKTGTVGGTVNDVGMITLPEGRGHLILAVYIKKSTRPESERERAIAEIARSAYDLYSMR